MLIYSCIFKGKENIVYNHENIVAEKEIILIYNNSYKISARKCIRVCTMHMKKGEKKMSEIMREDNLESPMHRQSIIKRYRGFNLLGMFCTSESKSSVNDGYARGYFLEEDYKIMADFGFDFARLPLSYRVWGSVDDPFKIDEAKLSKLDEAVDWGLKYNIHTNIAIHRAPGYCINDDEPVREKMNLWKEQEAVEAFKYHWCEIARRYKDISSEQLSFNVVNEPNATVTVSQYTNIIWQIVDAVRTISPDRMFMIDGLQWGDYPHIDTMFYGPGNLAYSTRGYRPNGISHYGIMEEYKNTPVWPGGEQILGAGKVKKFDRSDYEKFYGMYAALSEIYKVGVMCGEFGCSNHTPHSVTLAWMEDLLSVLKEYNIGWAMWHLRGRFGVFDSERADVDYEDYYGHKLDRKMMDLLMRY